MSTSECSSGCESGWTTYFDQSSNSADQYPKASSHRSQRSRAVNVDVEEDEDLSMVSDASSVPRHFHEEENCNDNSRYFSHAASGKQKKEIKEHQQREKQQQDAYLDDTASSPVLSFSKKNLAASINQASMEKETQQGLSGTHYKGKSALKKHFGLLKSSVSGKSASEKSSGLQGRKWQ